MIGLNPSQLRLYSELVSDTLEGIPHGCADWPQMYRGMLLAKRLHLCLYSCEVGGAILGVKNQEYNKDIQRVTKVIMEIWLPEPRKTDSSIPFLGGRKTSPWTNFHPNSSWASSWRRKQISRYDENNTSCVMFQSYHDCLYLYDHVSCGGKYSYSLLITANFTGNKKLYRQFSDHSSISAHSSSYQPQRQVLTTESI